MSRIHSAATFGLPLAAFTAWFLLYLPSAWAFHNDPLQLTHPLWTVAGGILNTLEPLSRGLPGWLLSGLGPLILLTVCVSLVFVEQRVTAYVLLLVTGATGISAFRYVVPVIGNALQPYAPSAHDPLAHAPLTTPMDVVFQSVGLLPQAVSAVAVEFGGSIAVGVTALIAAGAFRRALLTDPLRRGFFFGKGDNAGWMPAKIAKQLTNDGVPLGRYDGRPLCYPHRDPSRTFYQGHHFVIAATRSGKGVGAVVPAILDHDGPVTVVDIKGENLAVTRRHRTDRGFEVLALNPFGILEPSQTTLNPLDFIRDDHVSEDCAALAVAMIREESSDAGAHLMRLARDLVAAAIEVVYTQAAPEDRHLITVLDLLTGPGADTAFRAWMESPGLCGGRPARAISSFMGNDSKERNLVISTVRANLAFAGGDRMQAFLKNSGLKPDHILSGRTDIFIVIPLEQVEAQRNFLRLVTALVVNTIVSSPRRKLATSMLMVLDEFPVLGAMAQIKDLFTIGAGSNIVLLTIVQDLARLRDVWGHNGAQSLLAQSATVRVMGLGAGDGDTACWVSELLPKISVHREGRSYDSDDLMSKRVNFSEVERPLLTPDEVLSLPTTKLLALFRGQKPLLLDKIVYHRDREYRGRFDPNPYAD